MSELNYYTQEGLEAIKQELHDMRTRQRAEIAKAISEAREKGDLSENAEYDAAKEAQGLLEMKIAQQEKLLMNARILDETTIDLSKVYVLCIVKIKNKKTNQVLNYKLVSAKEANLTEGKISIDSPIGKGLLGKSVGDTVVITVPAGTMEFEILEISR